jgi:hypothetical protein
MLDWMRFPRSTLATLIAGFVTVVSLAACGSTAPHTAKS